MHINIGITDENRASVASGLSGLLSDTYLLSIKTHNFHWNVTGPQFTSLHLLFEQFYRELSKAVDVIAERIRALGYPALGSYQAFREHSQLVEETGVPSAEAMIRQLIQGQELILNTARTILPLAEASVDEVTLDLVIQRMQIHEKNAWMLRSLLE
jgi:starvation-inducible DNA-binding protein